MTEEITDQNLLRQYAEDGSESAFRSLVGRHVNLVFSTALRGLNSNEAAAEITQNVFITLARKGPWLCGETTVAPWLYQATLLEVRKWWRGEFRRQRREQTAIELGTLMKEDDSLLKALGGELDQGLQSLRDADRTALILRYFEGKSHKEIGALLGAREDAVRMRVNRALKSLMQFFRRRGYAVPAVAMMAAALTASVKAAPAGFAALAANSALNAGSAGGAALLNPWVAKLTGMGQTKTAVLCLGLVMAPVAWQWHSDQSAHKLAAANKAELKLVRDQQLEAAAQAQRLQAESAQLDGELANANQNRTRYQAAAAKLDALKARVAGLLTDPNYRWPDDLPYVRVAKSEVRSLDLLHKPGTFGMDGTLNEAAQEILGITAREKVPTEQALGNYWHTVLDMMNDNAYQTNIMTDASGQTTDTVIVPPLGDPLKTVATDTASQISNVLGADREQIVFGDWAQGGIQIFSPGNLWFIGDQAQVFTVWVGPNAAAGTPSYGYGWHVNGSGISSGNATTGFEMIPAGIFQKFFAPWLSQHGVTVTPTHSFGDSN